MDQDGTWHGGGPRSRPHCARWGPSSPPQKRHDPPIFVPCLLWSNDVCIRIPLRTEVGLSLGYMVLDGDPAFLPKRGTARQFSANVRCGQTTEWIKMPLGMEVGLGPGDLVFDGDPAPPEKHCSTQFWANVYCGQTAGWMKTPLGTEVDLGPGHMVLDRDPPPAKGAQQPPPFFGPCLLWLRSPILATAELLFVCA